MAGLKIGVRKRGEIYIRLPLGALKMAFKHAPFMNAYPEGDEPRITDARSFAEEVLYALQDEEEDGTTAVHRLFDRAFEAAIEAGADGLSYAEDRRP